MRCDLCPICPPQGEYGDDVCPEMDSPLGITHKDGMGGCKHPYNYVKKRDDEYIEHLAEMADYFAKEELKNETD
ncbi:MAG: hypothetical protein PUF49_09865 [Firmicutes bacterium]|nr:hypothetical protein [Bacillota bacterium]